MTNAAQLSRAAGARRVCRSRAECAGPEIMCGPPGCLPSRAGVRGELCPDERNGASGWSGPDTADEVDHLFSRVFSGERAEVGCRTFCLLVNRRTCADDEWEWDIILGLRRRITDGGIDAAEKQLRKEIE